MKVRIIVPLSWESQFRKDLFSKLKELGYRWSKGDSLDVDYDGLHKMAYVAIFADEPIVKFSSKIELGQKPTSECGFNYAAVYPTVDSVISSLRYLRQFLEYNPTEEELEDFIMHHHELTNNLLLL